MTLLTDEVETRRLELEDLTEPEIFTLIRKRGKVSQKDVAREAGITQSYLSAWETGRWSPPGVRSQGYWNALDRLLSAG
jgi:DNA-binding transcriptional regulator YiaG